MFPTRMTRVFPALLLAIATLTVSGCRSRSEAVALVNAAIEAHGGREALARLDNVSVVSEVRFKDQAPLTRLFEAAGADEWMMEIKHQDVSFMMFGMEKGRCWRKNRWFAWECTSEDRQEIERTASVLDARFLHRLDTKKLEMAEKVPYDNRPAPSVRAGNLRLVFHPDSHLLVQVKYEDDRQVETFSEFETVAGALVGTRRVFTIDGELDVDETWREIRPGEAAVDRIRGNSPTVAGDVVDELDGIRPVAWTEVSDVHDGLKNAVRSLEGFARTQGKVTSSSDGVLVTALTDGDSPSAPGRWQVAITLEVGTAFAPAEVEGFHLDTWTESRFVGVFFESKGHPNDAPLDSLFAEVKRRRLAPANGARPQVLLLNENKSGNSSMALVRIAVQAQE